MNDPNAAPEFLAILINWLPNIVIAIIWVIYFRKSIALQKAAVEETRRLADALERAAVTLEKRT